MRQGEVIGLEWERVERSRGVVLLDVTKSGKRREIPLCSRADDVLTRRWSVGVTGRVFPGRDFTTYRHSFESAVRRAKLVNFHFHDLRHTFASWAVQAGVTLQEVKELLGHSSMGMVLRYAHLSPDRHWSGGGSAQNKFRTWTSRSGIRWDGSCREVTDKTTRRGGRARSKASDSKSDRGPEGPSGVQILSPPPIFLDAWRGDRAAEGAALEMPCTGNPCAPGSNPGPSARIYGWPC